MSGQGATTTTQTQAPLPPHVLQGQIDLLAKAGLLTNPFTSMTPNFGVFGLTPDQMLANDLTRQTAQRIFTTPSVPALDAMNFGVGKGGAKASNAKAAQLAPGEISPFMNPYIEEVLDKVLARMKQQELETQARIGGDAAAAHMYGGSREAVQRMLADRNYRDATGLTSSNLMKSGWDTAAQLAQGNAQMRQAANLLNAQLGTNVSLANAQFQENEANRFLNALGMQNTMDNSALNRQMAILNMLNQFGGQQRAVGQQALDLPFVRLQQLLQSTPGFNAQSTNSTQTSSTEKPIDWGGLGLGILGILGKAGSAGSILGNIPFLSDRDDKTDVQKLGKDPETGVNMYAYRYRGDPKSYPKVVGPMADELEKIMPGVTRMLGKHRVVG